MPIHTLGSPVSLTGTRSHFTADGACEEAKHGKPERPERRNSLRSKGEKNMRQREEAGLEFLNLSNSGEANTIGQKAWLIWYRQKY